MLQIMQASLYFALTFSFAVDVVIARASGLSLTLERVEMILNFLLVA